MTILHLCFISSVSFRQKYFIKKLLTKITNLALKFLFFKPLEGMEKDANKEIHWAEQFCLHCNICQILMITMVFLIDLPGLQYY